MGGLVAFAAMAQAADRQIFVLPLMKAIVAPQAQNLWDVGNQALDDDGNASAARLTASDWTKLAGAAQKMKAASGRNGRCPRSSHRAARREASG